MDRVDLISGFLVTEGSIPALILEVARLSTSEANSSVGQVWVEMSSRSLLLILLILGVQLIVTVWVSVGIAKGLDRVFLTINLLLDVDYMSLKLFVVFGQGLHLVLKIIDYHWEFLKGFRANWGLPNSSGPLKDLDGGLLDNWRVYLVLLRVQVVEVEGDCILELVLPSIVGNFQL